MPPDAGLGALIPELALVAAAVVGLLVGSWVPRRRQWWVREIAAAACLAGIVTALLGPEGTPMGGYVVDTTTGAVRVVVLGATALVLSFDAMGRHRREAEFHVLTLLGALGSIVLAGATDLLLLFAGYLLASIPLYAMTGVGDDPRGAEATMKYYLLGVLLGVCMLAGITLLYGVGGGTGYAALGRGLPAAPGGVVAVGVVAVIGGLLFKCGAIPAHFWIPDVTRAAPIPTAAFVTTVPKIGGLAALYRLGADVLPGTGVDWSLLVAVVAAVSMTLGNLAAFFQRDVRRLLAYSTISQVGYLLMAVAVAGRGMAQEALLFYLAAYAVTNLGAFAVVAVFPDSSTLDEFRGLARRRPKYAVVLVICLLGLVGTPPTGVFLGKLLVFTAAVDGGLVWLAVLAVVNTVASLFYYLRWLVPACLAASDGGPVAAGRAPLAALAGAVSVGLGLAGGLVLPLLSGPPWP